MKLVKLSLHAPVTAIWTIQFHFKVYNLKLWQIWRIFQFSGNWSSFYGRVAFTVEETLGIKLIALDELKREKVSSREATQISRLILESQYFECSQNGTCDDLLLVRSAHFTQLTLNLRNYVCRINQDMSHESDANLHVWNKKINNVSSHILIARVAFSSRQANYYVAY